MKTWLLFRLIELVGGPLDGEKFVLASASIVLRVRGEDRMKIQVTCDNNPLVPEEQGTILEIQCVERGTSLDATAFIQTHSFQKSFPADANELDILSSFFKHRTKWRRV